MEPAVSARSSVRPPERRARARAGPRRAAAERTNPSYVAVRCFVRSLSERRKDWRASVVPGAQRRLRRQARHLPVAEAVKKTTPLLLAVILCLTAPEQLHAQPATPPEEPDVEVAPVELDGIELFRV